MNKVLFLFVIINIFKVNAQTVFCAPGAEWHYRYNFLGYPPYNNNNVFNEKIKYERDTIIGTETAKVLVHKSFFLECTNHTSALITLIKQQHDTVFFQNNFTYNTITSNNDWQLLYVYSDTAGQSWSTKIKDNSNILTFTTTVNSISTVTVNGFPLKRLNVTYYMKKNNAYVTTYTTTITERFGCDMFMFNYYNSTYGACDADYYSSFLCYSDSTFGLKQFTAYSCDYSYTVGLKENASSKNTDTIFPNPANMYLNITLTGENEFTKAKIINYIGQVVKEVSLNTNEHVIDIYDLSNGAYILQLSGNKDAVSLNKHFVIYH